MSSYWVFFSNDLIFKTWKGHRYNGHSIRINNLHRTLIGFDLTIAVSCTPYTSNSTVQKSTAKCIRTTFGNSRFHFHVHKNSLILAFNCGFVVCKSSFDRFNRFPYAYFYILILRISFASCCCCWNSRAGKVIFVALYNGPKTERKIALEIHRLRHIQLKSMS